MKSDTNFTANSINHNGCSICTAGKETYTIFRPANRQKKYCQYDYRHRDGELFSTVAPTLQLCRDKRDKWLQAKYYKKLFPAILKKIQEGKRLSKFEMGYQIGQAVPLHVVSISWDLFKRDEIVSTFNKMFGTEIQ